MTGLVFAASSASKLRSRSAYQAFRVGLRETRLVPERRLAATTAALAGAEAVVAVVLVAAAVIVSVGAAGATALGLIALSAAASLTAVLAVGVATVVRRGISARCACFGAGARQLSRLHLVRNLCLLAVQAAGLALAPLARRPAPATATIAAVAGLVFALVFIRWEDIASLFAPLPSAAADPAHRGRPHRYGQR
jgi:hypothetical protein